MLIQRMMWPIAVVMLAGGAESKRQRPRSVVVGVDYYPEQWQSRDMLDDIRSFGACLHLPR